MVVAALWPRRLTRSRRSFLPPKSTESRHTISSTSISIVGLGTYARAIGTRGVEAGHAVEVIGRDSAKAEDLATALGGGATTGTFGTAPAGDIVILAVPYASAVPVVAQYGDALAGKVIIDISDTFTAADDTELVTLTVLPARRRSPRPSRRARTS